MTPALRTYFSILDKIAPGYAASKMLHVLSNPRQKKLRDFENDILDQSEKTRFDFQGFEIQSYRWGKGNAKKAICVHGWEGQAGNFGGIVNTLLEKDYEVIAVDAPSHGYSSRGNTNMFQYIDLISQIMKEELPEIIISHSFGSVVSGGVLRYNSDINVKDWIMITTPNSFRERIQDVSNQLTVTDRTINKLIGKIEEATGEHIDDLSMAKYTSVLDNVSKALIIHSIHDKILPIHTSRKVHDSFSKSEMIELENLGHYKILWAEEVLDIIRKRVE